MEIDYEWAALRGMLENLNKGKKTITAKEIDEMTPERTSAFKLYKIIEGLLGLEEKKYIRKREQDIYDILIGIKVLREVILKYAKGRKQQSSSKRGSMRLNKLLDSEWVITKNSRKNTKMVSFEESDFEDGADDPDADSCDFDEDDIEALNVLRRAGGFPKWELLKRMREELDDILGEDDGIDVSEDTDDSDDGEEGAFKDEGEPVITQETEKAGHDLTKSAEGSPHATKREIVLANTMIHDGNDRWHKEDSLMFAIGKDEARENVYGDIALLKHILIGGSRHSGKSTFLHTMIYTFIARYSPEDVRLVLCDAKNTEFACYNGMPHLLTGQIITGAEQFFHSLQWANEEVKRRFQLFEGQLAENSERDIAKYNAASKNDEEKLPRIVYIVDGYEDFILATKCNIGEEVRHLMQKSNEAGIHLVLAMQPVNAILADLKMSAFTRIAFRVGDRSNSDMILGECGAENLFECGDMLIREGDDVQCRRIRGAYIPHEVLLSGVAAAKKTYKANFDEQASDKFTCAENVSAQEIAQEYPDDPYCIKALAIVIRTREVSISLVQRLCGIGYLHAARTIEWMEKMGYVSPFNRTKGRRIFITESEFIKKYGRRD